MHDALAELPYSLREQVLGYAESVERALPEIFKSNRRKFDKNLGDKIVFMSGVRKLYSLVSSSYWTLENSAYMLNEEGISSIKIGSSDFSRGSDIYRRLKGLISTLEKEADRLNFYSVLNMTPSELLTYLDENGY